MDRGSSYLRGERFHGVNLPGAGVRLASRVAASFKEKKGGGRIRFNLFRLRLRLRFPQGLRSRGLRRALFYAPRFQFS